VKQLAGVQDDEEEEEEEEEEQFGAIVSNHVSYLDILYHMSASFPSFVAKVSHIPCFVFLLQWLSA
jgi:1-acyl-sn-glycerol-3-phosphate acyltransferase